MSSETTAPKPSAEARIERAILAARWLLLVFYAGLAFALALYAVSFIYKCAKLAVSLFALTTTRSSWRCSG